MKVFSFVGLALMAVGVWILWRVFLRKKTPLEEHFAEQDALQALGYQAADTVIDTEPSVSYLGVFPLAGIHRTPLSTQPAVPIKTGFLPDASGRDQGGLIDPPMVDYRIGDANKTASYLTVYGLGVMDVWGNPMAPQGP